MKKLLHFFMFFAAISFCLTACDKDTDPDPDPDPNPTNTTFTFFKKDASWTYDSYDSDDPGIVISVVYTITNIDSDGWATVTWTLAGFPAPTQQWFADNSKFSKLCSKQSGKMLILCTANPSVGDVWTETWVDGSNVISDSVRVIALNETVIVPAGTFDGCIKLRETTSDDPVYYTYYWFSKTKGIIKTESTTQEDFPTIIYQELKSYQ